MKKLACALALAAVTLGVATPAAGQEATQISLLHGIPEVPVDVAVDGQVLIPGFQPGTVQDLSTLPGQTFTDLEVRAAGTEEVLIGPIAEFQLPSEGSSSVVAHLDATGTPTITLFENDTSPLPGGTGRLTIRHAAAAPPVDLVAGDARPVEGLENGGSAGLDLIAGELTGLQLQGPDGQTVAEVPDVDLQVGTNLIVYAVGSADEGTLTFYTEERALDMGDGPTPDDDALGDGETDQADDGMTDDQADEGMTDDQADDGMTDDQADGGTDMDGGTSDPAVDADMDATPEPTAVNTGVPLSSSSQAAVLFAGALGALAIAVGALVVRRRTTDDRVA